MKITCNYCGAYISDTDEFCGNCGAPNEELKRVANGAPKTIDELKQWYIDKKLPPKETTRFFIGENYRGARAFGIYYDEKNQNFIVYKNKGDGSRAIRYEGDDEEYAVNEIYQKLKEEIVNQKRNSGQRKKSNNASGKSGSKNRRNRRNTIGNNLFLILFVLCFCGTWVFGCFATLFRSCVTDIKTSYYLSNDYAYEIDDDGVYTFDTDGDGDFSDEKPLKYESSSSSSDDWDDDDWDSDWDSSYDSWDSGSSDWDSDW